MTTTLLQQQDAIGEAMKQRANAITHTNAVGVPSPTSNELQNDKQWAALNDAASTVASVRMSKSAHEQLKEQHTTALGQVRELKKANIEIIERERTLREALVQIANAKTTPKSISSAIYAALNP